LSSGARPALRRVSVRQSGCDGSCMFASRVATVDIRTGAVTALKRPHAGSSRQPSDAAIAMFSKWRLMGETAQTISPPSVYDRNTAWGCAPLGLCVPMYTRHDRILARRAVCATGNTDHPVILQDCGKGRSLCYRQHRPSCEPTGFWQGAQFVLPATPTIL
jgi:hypothetical protein